MTRIDMPVTFRTNDQKADPANPTNIIIGVMGLTGTGKSSLIQRLTDNQSIEIRHSVQPAASKIGCYNYVHKDGRCVTLIDSPGFNDSFQADIKILREIATFLEVQFNKDKKLSGIIYLHQISEKIRGVADHNSKKFQNLCAPENVLVVTTRWDEVKEQDREAMVEREKALMEMPGECFQPIIAAGGRPLRHDNTAESARKIMEECLKNHSISPQIQLGLREGKKFEDTAAGSELAAELKKRMDEHSGEMKILREEMAKAIAAKDEALKKELEAEREEAKKRQEEADLKLREQGVEFNRRVKEMEDKAEKERMKLKVDMDKMSSERITADKKLKNLEVVQKAAASKSRAEQARIQVQVKEAQKEKEAIELNHRKLLRSLRAQVCHWQPFTDKVNSADFKLTPINAGIRDDLSTFIMRYRTESHVLSSIREGLRLTVNGGFDFSDSQVLVGSRPRVTWISRHGRFQVDSMRHNPVPGWDKEVDGVSNTKFIARFSHLGDFYVTGIVDGSDGASKKINGALVKVKDYAVLCYKDL